MTGIDESLFAGDDFEVATEADLGKINELVEEWKAKQAAVEAAESRLSQAKEELRKIETDLLPNTMMELGVSSVTTNDGLVVEVKPVVDGGILRGHEEEAIQWLDENGYGDLVKASIAVNLPREERDKARAALETLRSLGIDATVKNTVHPQTMKAFIRSCDESGIAVPEDKFRVYRGLLARPRVKR